MKAGSMDVGIVGLGVMGANLARNFASRGHAVVGFNRRAAVTRRLAAEYPEVTFVALVDDPTPVPVPTPPALMLLLTGLLGLGLVRRPKFRQEV